VSNDVLMFDDTSDTVAATETWSVYVSLEESWSDAATPSAHLSEMDRPNAEQTPRQLIPVQMDLPWLAMRISFEDARTDSGDYSIPATSEGLAEHP
jgi:hypothetical protein